MPNVSLPFWPAPWAVETGFTPGVSTSSWVKLRPCSGISAMTFSSITFPSSVEEACSSSDWAVTSTTSLTAPTSRRDVARQRLVDADDEGGERGPSSCPAARP